MGGCRAAALIGAMAATITLSPLAAAPARAAAVVDPHAEVAAALYAASATQAAEQRSSDAAIRAERTQIDRLTAQVKAGAAQRAQLVAAQDRYVAELAAKDAAYATEIAVFRGAVTNIASTPEGAAALARFNGGDEVGALSILDKPGAHAKALAAAQTQADNLCRGFAASTSFRFRAATLQPATWTCVHGAGGVVCGFEGAVSCQLDEKATVEKEICGPLKTARAVA